MGGTRSMYMNIRGQIGKFGTGMPAVLKWNDINNEMLVAVQIETADAAKNIAEICQVPGLDIAFIGPGDLGLSTGLIQEHGFGVFQRPEFKTMLNSVVENCKKNNVVPGFWGGPAMLPMIAGAGFKFMVMAADVHILVTAMEKTTEEVAEEMKKLSIEWQPTPNLVMSPDL